MKELLTAAHREVLSRSSEEMAVGDVPAVTLTEAKWASHSWRRGGTKKARSLMEASGATETLIDLHFRWRIKEMRQKMQLHYAGDTPRSERLKVTYKF